MSDLAAINQRQQKARQLLADNVGRHVSASTFAVALVDATHDIENMVTDLAALRAENERLRDELESLRAQLYGTQCEDCAGQGMPQKAVLYCCHCGQPFTRVVEEV